MSSRVDPGPFSPTILIPGSKSYANRYLILAACRGQGTLVEGLPQAEDVVSLLRCLEAIGVGVLRGADRVQIDRSFPDCETDIETPLDLEVGEGGTTARFLLALLARGRRCYRLKLAGRLALRPWEELFEALRLAGARIALQGSVIEVQGPVQAAKLPRQVSAARSSQFASALQLAFAQSGQRFDVEALESSAPYWEMTLACLEQLRFPAPWVVPADWSSAAYPLCLAAVAGQEVALPNLRHDKYQADSVLLEVLDRRGAIRLNSLTHGIVAQGLHDFRPLSMDMRHCLDLTPALAFLCAHLEGESELRGLGGLVHKESDRLQAIHDLLTQVGVRCRLGADSLSVQGPVAQGPWDLETPPDHRLVMVAALFLRAHQGGTLRHPSCVEKSFPQFFKAMGF